MCAGSVREIVSLFPEGRRLTDDGALARVAALRTRVADWVRARRADRAFRRRTLSDGTPAADAPRHVVVVVVDALRADAVDLDLTPFLASLSPTAAVSPSTWTFPAVSSLLTGRYPHVHGATRRVDDHEHSVADVTPLPPRLDDGVATLPERLAGAGYDAFGGFAMIVPFLALCGRFRTHRLLEGAGAERLLAEHRSWLADRRDDRTFSYLHLSDLHEPVAPPADYAADHDVDTSVEGVRRWRHEDVPRRTPTVERYRTHRWRLYRAAVEYVDHRLAAHHARLTDHLDDLALVVTGDHGEAFWEHAAFDAAHFADPRPAYCVGHGGAPYEAVTRVPLGVAAAGSTGGLGRVDPDGRVSLVDVVSTVLDAAGLDGGTTTDDGAGADGPPVGGTSLLDEVPDRRILVEGVRYGYEKKAVYDGGRKLVVSRGDDVAVEFSLPAETPSEIPESAAAAMREALPAWPEGEGRRHASEAVERRLANLGYA